MGTSTQASESTQVRIGDKEREDCLDLLTQHHVEGRLDLEEMSRRHQVALMATTRGDLRALLVDLPSPGTGAFGTSIVADLVSTSRPPVGAPRRGGTAKRTARHAVAAAGVGLTAFLGTKGIDDAAVRQVAWNASWITGACGYLGALLASRWR